MKTKKLKRKIFKTYDYSLFKKLRGNRDLREAHLKAITMLNTIIRNINTINVIRKNGASITGAPYSCCAAQRE
jgi:hypothetical protein